MSSGVSYLRNNYKKSLKPKQACDMESSDASILTTFSALSCYAVVTSGVVGGGVRLFTRCIYRDIHLIMGKIFSQNTEK